MLPNEDNNDVALGELNEFHVFWRKKQHKNPRKVLIKETGCIDLLFTFL